MKSVSRETGAPPATSSRRRTRRPAQHRAPALDAARSTASPITGSRRCARMLPSHQPRPLSHRSLGPMRPDAARDPATTVPGVALSEWERGSAHPSSPRAIRCARPRAACTKRLWTDGQVQPGTRWLRTESDAGGAEHTSRVQFAPRCPDAVQRLGGPAVPVTLDPAGLPGRVPGPPGYPGCAVQFG